jgi:hypothetical protein
MARKVYRVDVLSVSSIEQLKRDLMDYRDRELPDKVRRFASRLADHGISVARDNTGVLDDLGNVSSLVRFTKQVDYNKYGAKAVMIMADIMPVISTWWTSNGLKSVEVSPSLMYEYGSGNYAKDLNAIKNPQGGKGTFPGQTHAKDPDGWWWVDENNKRHESKGITPTHPMYYATQEMYAQVVAIAREVFG